MASKYALIGIAVGVFFAGLGVGYAVFSASAPSGTAGMQQWHNMMQDPNQRQQMMSQMMQDPQIMNEWMNRMMSDPQSMQNMHQTMLNSPQHMQQMAGMMGPDMMGHMMSDPQMSQQMMGMMMQNQQFMHGMMMDPEFQHNWMGPWMMNNTNWQGMGSGMMNQGMMGSGMMGGGMMMGNMMMGSPITSDADVVKTIDSINSILDQVSSEYGKGNADSAFSLATAAYLENYEYVEGKIASKDSQLMEKIELMLRRDLRHMINNNYSVDEVNSHIDSIKEELAKARALF